MPERTCSVEGCDKAHRARGYCSTHYNQQLQPQRHAKVTMPCGWCKKPCEKESSRANRYGALFCSMPCRDEWRAATGTNPHPTPEASAKGRAAWDIPRSRARAKLRKAARGIAGTRWVAGVCLRCGGSFVSALGTDLGRYCSNVCKRRTKASRRRAREHGAYHEPYSRRAVFERDRWRCHICKRMTLPAQVVPHPRAPVLDHLVPLSEGGDDTAANVATACFLCNSVKRECGGGEQLALI